MQNVTSFYHQEEQLLYSLVERVLGITDLFLGVSPTRELLLAMQLVLWELSKKLWLG